MKSKHANLFFFFGQVTILELPDPAEHRHLPTPTQSPVLTWDTSTDTTENGKTSLSDTIFKLTNFTLNSSCKRAWENATP